MPASPHTPTELMAAATDLLLENNNYRQIENGELASLEPYRGRFFEDAYGVVSVVVYETWSELIEVWPEDQARLVDLMTAHMSRQDAKAWEGYLVLLSTASPPEEQRSVVEEIRYNVSRVRKLISVGDEVQTLGDVETAMLPVLPLKELNGAIKEESALDLLPKLLERRGVQPQATAALVEAFCEQQSLLERLHELGGQE